MPFVVQDGSPFELQDGSNLLAQGESGVTPIPPASATTSAGSLTPAAILPPAAGATATARALFPSAVIPAASATATAFAPSALTPISPASATASAAGPLVPPVIPPAAATASAHVPLPAVLIPPASATAAAFPLTDILPLPFASSTTSAGTLMPAVVMPPASAVASAHQPIPPALPIGVALATASGHALLPAPLIPVARAKARARMLTPPAGSALNPGYPLGKLDERIELLLGGTWTDITAAALPSGQQSASIKSGTPDGSQTPNPFAMAGTWDNADASLSPRNTAGPYFGELRQNTPARVSAASPYGTYLRLENDDEDLASVADTSALHVTGSMELRLEAVLSDYSGCTLAARNDGSTPSWSWVLNTDGTQTFSWFESGGTARHVTSDAAAAVSWRAYRVTMLATTGTVTFYVGSTIDGTWTQLGDAASGTSGAATTVRAGNSPLIVGWSASGGTQLRGQVAGFRLYSGIGGTRAADAAFALQVPGVTTWLDYAGLTWNLSGGAEVTARDYRAHLELASSNPTADVSSSKKRVQAQLSGRLRRMQQGSAPTAESAMRRAILAQTGSLFPVIYWPMEDGAGSGFAVFSRTFGPAAGAQLLTATLGKVQPAADSSFECSAPLPTLNGDSLTATVDAYTGATAWTVRFPCKIGTLPASGTTERLASVNLASGTVRRVDVIVDDTGGVGLAGFNSGGGSVFTTSRFSGFDVTNPKWWSIEGTTSGSSTIFNVINLAPGATLGEQLGGTLPSTSGAPANVSSITFNPDLFFTDTTLGHVTVQKAWTTLFALGAPLNAWRNELAANRFVRVCSEEGIPCRIIGRPSSSQALGPQPRGTAAAILRDCAQTEQGLLFEPMGCFGLGLRTRESLGAQAAGLTLTFASAANLRGDLSPVDSDTGFLNDVTGSTPGGTSWRQVLNDGSAKSVSEPKAGGMGTYAGSVPFPLNVADDGELQAAVAFYLSRVSVDEQRYTNVIGDMGIPGAPYADIARLRPGDLIVITDVPAVYQTADIHALATGATEALGPGRRITWDTIPASPYGA